MLHGDSKGYDGYFVRLWMSIKCLSKMSTLNAWRAAPEGLALNPIQPKV